MKEIVEVLEYRADTQNFEEFLYRIIERLKVYRHVEHLIVKIRRMYDCSLVELEVKTNLIVGSAGTNFEKNEKSRDRTRNCN